jgi:tetratricopeptide (TPR) repeat protein
MLRRVFLLSLVSLLSISASAQFRGQKPSVDWDPRPQPFPTSTKSRSMTAAGARISAVRLREPAKARRLLSQASKAWAAQKPAEAERKLKQALDIYPSFPEALTFCGFIQAARRQWDMAEESVHSAIQVDPSYSPAYVVLAGIYNGQSRFQDAQQASEQALVAGANTWDVQYEIARALIGKHEYDRALTVTEKALHNNHGTLLHLAKAYALARLKRYRESVTELRTYLHYQPRGEGSQNARNLLDQLQPLAGE